MVGRRGFSPVRILPGFEPRISRIPAGSLSGTPGPEPRIVGDKRN